MSSCSSLIAVAVVMARSLISASGAGSTDASQFQARASTPWVSSAGDILHSIDERRSRAYDELSDVERDELHQSPTWIPPASIVTRIEIEFQDGMGLSGPLRVFSVPKEQYRMVLSAFGTPVVDASPKIDRQEVATLKVFIKGLGMRRISVWMSTATSMPFCNNGIPCYRVGGENDDIRDAIAFVDMLSKMYALTRRAPESQTCNTESRFGEFRKTWKGRRRK